MGRHVWLVAVLVTVVGVGIGHTAPPADPPHDDFAGGRGHARIKSTPFTSHCTDCHAIDLRGGWGPSCYYCHDEEWDSGDSGNAAPPLDHTILKGGMALHKPGFGTPLAQGCTLCHGPNLDDGFATSCYTCHDRNWAGQGPPADHTEILGGFAQHKPGYGNPLGNQCRQCHGSDLSNGFAPSCYACHGPAAAPHDFSSRTWLGANDTSCTPCHEWGNWKHTASPTVGYQVTTTTLALVGDPLGVSARCLGCHEGNVAVDDYQGGPAVPSEFITGGSAFGTDLTHHHPVSFEFDSVLAEAHRGLRDPATTASGLAAGGTIARDMLTAGRLECNACHDPHDNALGNFLVKAVLPQAGSTGLCFTCHLEQLPATVTGMHHIPLRDQPWDRGQCTLCHGNDLLGGGGVPGCVSCHNPFSAPDLPPPGHHGADRTDPYTNCTSCHGPQLQGAEYGSTTAPGCYECHGDVWSGVNLPPVVDVGGPYHGTLGQPVAFDASNTWDPNPGDTLTYVWDFGDGSDPVSTGRNPSAANNYPAAKTFHGTLTVSDGVNAPVVVPFDVEITRSLVVPGPDRWSVTTTGSPSETFAITIEDHEGMLVVLKEDAGGATTLAIGIELTGVIFWMDVWLDVSGGVGWGTGDMFFGNINRPQGTMLGILFGKTGNLATFQGVKQP